MRGTSTPRKRRNIRVAVVALGVPVLMAVVPAINVSVSHVRAPAQADAQWMTSVVTPAGNNVVVV